MQSYYEEYWTETGFNPRRDDTPRGLRRLFEQHVRPTDDCLDIGCGDGGTSGIYLSRHARSYVGADVSRNAVGLTRSRGLDAIVIDDAADLPFESGTFDVVVCSEVLEHLFEPQRAAAEALRVLRPGGRFIATVPNAAYWRDRLDALFGVWQPGGDLLGRSEPWRSPHIRFFRPATLNRMLASVGFRRIDVLGLPSPVFGRVPLLRNGEWRGMGAIANVGARLAPSLLAGSVAAVAWGSGPPHHLRCDTAHG